MIKRLLNFIPFAGVLTMNMLTVAAYVKTLSLGFIPLIVVGVVIQFLTLEILTNK